MTALRWLLGLTSLVACLGWMLLAIAAHDFRQSMGASPVGLLRLAALPIVLLIVLATVTLPVGRGILHAAAVAMAFTALAAAVVLRESTLVGGVGLLYCGLWFVFYYRALSALVSRG
jgi:hypothetical protein